jgi:hypothetical protein
VQNVFDKVAPLDPLTYGGMKSPDGRKRRDWPLLQSWREVHIQIMDDVTVTTAHNGMDRCPVKQGDEQSSPCFYVFAPENSKKNFHFLS